MSGLMGLEIDDELLNHIHESASLSRAMSILDARLSLNQRMLVSYDLIDMDGKYGFMQEFTQDEIHGYFSQMNKFATVSMNEIIDRFGYTAHFHDSKIKGNLLRILKDKTPNKIDDEVLIYHFALVPEDNKMANRERGDRNARVYFLVGKYGIVHILFFDPFHEINPVLSAS